ncbi:MAG TPA: glycosyltransferase [Azospirillum sp.]|nr:glycosyltransferase [Azospirillum sp.]
MGITAGHIAKVPHILWNVRCSDMNMQEYRWMSRPLPWLLAKLSPMPDAVVINSETGRRVHEYYGYEPRSWEMIPNGFDLTRFRPDAAARQRMRAELGVPDVVVLIGLPARFDPMKDHLTFLAAATNLVEKEPNVGFVLIGRGLTDDNQWLRSRIAACGLGKHVHLLGERKGIDRLLPGLDIVTLSSAFGEGFPNVLGEAMACGVPCISTDVGDAAHIIGDTGLVVAVRDPTAMAVAWRTLILAGAERRRELGRRARERIAENFSLPLIIGRYEALYEEVAGIRRYPLLDTAGPVRELALTP